MLSEISAWHETNPRWQHKVLIKVLCYRPKPLDGKSYFATFTCESSQGLDKILYSNTKTSQIHNPLAETLWHIFATLSQHVVL